LTASESTTAQELSIQVTDTEGGALVCLRGRVTIDSSPRVREQLLGLFKQQPLPKLTIDLSGLSYIDCSGIATLIEALKIARQCKTQLQLRGLRDGPRRLLEVIGLVQLFDTDGGPDRSPASKVS